MVTKNLIALSLVVLGISLSQQTNESKGINSKSPGMSKNGIFSNLHTLSIHIKDLDVHDSVFHFLRDKLQLPVYYNPVSLGMRKYAGIFAGNLVLEPCGPYTHFSYATDFRAIFFGLNFETDDSINAVSKVLDGNNIKYKIDGDEYIYPEDPNLVGENIFIGISNRHEKQRDHARQDSLRSIISQNNNSGLGIEYVKEVRIGYSKASQLQKWQEFISPSAITSENLWKIGNGLSICFIPGTIKEVNGIVFKVKSLEKAKQYMADNQLSYKETGQEILLEPMQAFGLSLCFSE